MFLKRNSKGIVTHGVQPNKESTAPIGWVLQPNGLYSKKPIWYLETLELGTVKGISTTDGFMNYEIKNPSVLVAQDKNNQPDLSDTWVIDSDIFNRDYDFNETQPTVNYPNKNSLA